MPSSPADAELSAATAALRAAHPGLGIVKLWAALKAAHPEWTVSEKRFRKALSALTPTPTSDELVAQTGLDPTLDISSIAPKVKAKVFGGTKGKGLVATSKLQQGELVWAEEPWVACPDPGLRKHLREQVLCSHCLALWAPPPPGVVACRDCAGAWFCNRLCMSRGSSSGSHHALLCAGVNPAAARLGAFVEEREWRSIDVVARIIAKWRGEHAWGEPGAAEAIERRVWDATARMNIRTREEGKDDWPRRSAATERQWREGHALLVATLNPTTGPEARKFAAALQARARGRRVAPLSEAEEARWFSYEAFLELLGMVNINLEDSGGLYALHCHMNHSCEPNVQVRNLPKGFVPPPPEALPAPLPPPLPRGVRGTHKLSMLARRTIHPGDELTVSYVDAALPRRARRQALRDGYGFWCVCARCQREEREEEKERERLKKEREAEAAKEAKREEKGERGEVKPEGKGEEKEGGKVDELAAQMDELAVDDML